MSRTAQQYSLDLYAPQEDVLGEAPLWSTLEQTLYWLDIARKRLYCRGPSDVHHRSWSLPDHPGCLAELTSKTIAIAMGEGLHRVDRHSGALAPLCMAPPRRPGTRFNDGKVDPLGRFWVGTMQNNFGPSGESLAVERSDGALYRFDTDGRAHTIEEDIGIANTLAWSPDLKHFYFADSLRGAVYIYDFDASSGDARNKRVLFDAAGYGVPDGSAIDSDGCLWNARWDAGVILRITPRGEIDKVLRLPVPRPTSCAFGGGSLDTLYVTSARLGLSADEIARHPHSGSVLAITGLAQGVAVPPYSFKDREQQSA